MGDDNFLAKILGKDDHEILGKDDKNTHHWLWISPWTQTEVFDTLSIKSVIFS